MKVIIDECVPHLVKRRLPHRQIKTVQEMGWAGVKNGELLKLVEEVFEIFITSDKNLRYQQDLTGRKLAIILLPSNQVEQSSADHCEPPSANRRRTRDHSVWCLY